MLPIAVKPSRTIHSPSEASSSWSVWPNAIEWGIQIASTIVTSAAKTFHAASRDCMNGAYFTEIGIRISIIETMGLPACIAGKNRHRLSVSSRARLRSGSLVG